MATIWEKQILMTIRCLFSMTYFMEETMARIQKTDNFQHNIQLRRLEPPVTVQRNPRRCLIQVNCPEFRQEELAFNLDKDSIVLSGNPFVTQQETAQPDQFEYRIPLGFNASKTRTKSVFLDGVFSVLIKRPETIAL